MVIRQAVLWNMMELLSKYDFIGYRSVLGYGGEMKEETKTLSEVKCPKWVSFPFGW